MVLEFFKVCDENDIAEGKIITLEVRGFPIALARYEGALYAIDNICTHDGGNLGEGNVIKGQIQCPRHGARFDLKSGEATRMPAAIGINRYEMKIENGQIFVGIPE